MNVEYDVERWKQHCDEHGDRIARDAVTNIMYRLQGQSGNGQSAMAMEE